MRLLVLGGTDFVGRAIVEDAVARGWNVSVLNRGHGSAPPAGVHVYRADRTHPDGLEALGEDTWDAVVDTWSWAPRAVRDAAVLLSDRAELYAYISSRSVYTFPTAAGADESAPIVDSSPDDTTFDDYPRAKAGGELAAAQSFGDRTLLVRAGLILGPHENIGRLPWWLTRMAQGGSVLAPGPATAGIQYVDARDLAAWTLTTLERRTGGTFDVVSPRGFATMGDLLEACVAVTGAAQRNRAALQWSDPDLILAAGIEPWTELPVWLPAGELHDTMHGADVSKAVRAGLRIRPIIETVADTWAWLDRIGGVAPQRADRPIVGLTAEREAAFLRTQ